MKKLLLIFSLLSLGSSLFAQNWLWAKGTTNVNYGSYGDPLGIAADSAGNSFDAGVYDGGVQFGAYSVNTNS